MDGKLSSEVCQERFASLVYRLNVRHFSLLHCLPLTEAAMSSVFGAVLRKGLTPVLLPPAVAALDAVVTAAVSLYSAVQVIAP